MNKIFNVFALGVENSIQLFYNGEELVETRRMYKVGRVNQKTTSYWYAHIMTDEEFHQSYVHNGVDERGSSNDWQIRVSKTGRIYRKSRDRF